ncbi:Hypothetical_protein [Hexamita inflata]|uniref:Hypothetical_protein n=1 Tax=Hexamita inflata TaxID=28002 RepID=A0AA86QQ81_9EUKA|nr:Hypothetical protein HINF_LOCUS43600 [Hexamita inflata]
MQICCAAKYIGNSLGLDVSSCTALGCVELIQYHMGSIQHKFYVGQIIDTTATVAQQLQNQAVINIMSYVEHQQILDQAIGYTLSPIIKMSNYKVVQVEFTRTIIEQLNLIVLEQNSSETTQFN